MSLASFSTFEEERGVEGEWVHAISQANGRT